MREFMVVKPYPVAMIQTLSGEYIYRSYAIIEKKNIDDVTIVLKLGSTCTSF